MIGKNLSALGFGLIITLGMTGGKVFAHGSIIQYHPKESIELEAKFDNGMPMKNAQVVIYAPDNPTTPWLTSTTDDAGKFTFSPDYTQSGEWTVKVRSAGHGSIINIPIKSEKTEAENSSSTPPEIAPSQETSSPTIIQKMMMAATGVWGFVGTALFFSRAKKD